jgi:O-antigen/teichoic acid export membrane protein
MTESLARQAVSVLANRWVSRAANFAVFIILARLLSTSEFGLYGIFTSAVFLVETGGNLGLRQASAHQIGQGALTDARALGGSLLIWPVVSILSAVAIVASFGGASDVDISSWILPAIVAASGVILGSFCQGVFLGRGEIRNFNFVEMTPRIIMLIGIGILWPLSLVSLQSQSWVFALAFFSTALFALLRARPSSGLPVFSASALWQLIKQGWPFALTLFLIMLNTRVSVFILSSKIDPESAGQYFAALRINDLLLDVAAAIGVVLFSHGARSKDTKRAVEQATEVTRWLVWGSVLISAIGIVLSPIMLPLLLGTKYAPAVPSFQILLVAMPFATLTKVVYPTLAGVGRPLLGAAVLGPALVLNAGLSYWLSQVMGSTGAAVSLAIGQILIAITFVAITHRLFAIPVRDFILPRRKDLKYVTDGFRKKLGRRRQALK